MPQTDKNCPRLVTTQRIKRPSSAGLFPKSSGQVLSVGMMLLTLALLLPAPVATLLIQQSAGAKVAVRAQDSISYLALRHYGFYSDSLLAILQKANRHIQDWQNLPAGTTLDLPALPASAPRLETLRSSAALAVLTFFEGTVQYHRGTNRQYQPAVLNLVLRPGDEILTSKDSRAELVLDQRSVLRLEASSRLRLVQLAREQQKQESYQGLLELMTGSVWTRLTKIIDRAPKVDLQFPAAIAGVQGTAYRAHVAADSTTNVRVYEGSVEVRSKPAGPPQRLGPPQQVPGPQRITLEAWIKLVRAQQEINIAKNGRPGEPQPFTDQGAEAGWVRWNQLRDRDLNAGR